MVGKSGMGLMVDEQLIQLPSEDLISYLRTIRAEDIARIKVITNPPAKYEAEVNSGLINIVLKKETINRWNISLRSAYRQSTLPSGYIGGAISFRQNGFTFYSDVS